MVVTVVVVDVGGVVVVVVVDCWWLLFLIFFDFGVQKLSSFFSPFFSPLIFFPSPPYFFDEGLTTPEELQKSIL